VSAQRDANPGSLRAWIVGAIVASVLATGAMLAALSYAQFERVYNQHNEARFALVMDDLEQGIERFLALGLQLSTMEELDGFLARAAGLNPEVRRIQVLDATGRTVAEIGQPGAAGERRLTLSTTLENGGSITVGRLDLSYARLGIAGQAGVLGDFLRQTAVLMAPAGLLVGVLCWLVLGRLRARILGTAAAVEAAAEGRADADPEAADALDPRLGEAMRRIAEARAAADEARGLAADGRTG
jgi:hypothetical protein